MCSEITPSFSVLNVTQLHYSRFVLIPRSSFLPFHGGWSFWLIRFTYLSGQLTWDNTMVTNLLLQHTTDFKQNWMREMIIQRLEYLCITSHLLPGIQKQAIELNKKKFSWLFCVDVLHLSICNAICYNLTIDCFYLDALIKHNTAIQTEHHPIYRNNCIFVKGQSFHIPFNTEYFPSNMCCDYEHMSHIEFLV